MLIDAKGRLFGRLNIIDGAVAVFAVLLLGFAYRLYRIATFPPPIIESVEPQTAVPGYQGVIRVTGKHFGDRVFIKVSRDALTGQFQPAYRIDARTVQMQLLQPLLPGVYTVIVVNGANKMVQVPMALRIERVAGLGPGAHAVTIRMQARAFGVIEPLAQLVTVGDSDRRTDAAHSMAARIERVDTVDAAKAQFTPEDKDLSMEVLLTVVQDGKQLYFHEEELRVGSDMLFEGPDYNLPCTIFGLQILGEADAG